MLINETPDRSRAVVTAIATTAMLTLNAIALGTTPADEAVLPPVDAAPETDSASSPTRERPDAIAHDAPPPMLTFADQVGKVREFVRAVPLDAQYSNAATNLETEAIIWSLATPNADLEPLISDVLLNPTSRVNPIDGLPAIETGHSDPDDHPMAASTPAPGSAMLLALAACARRRRR